MYNECSPHISANPYPPTPERHIPATILNSAGNAGLGLLRRSSAGLTLHVVHLQALGVPLVGGLAGRAGRAAGRARPPLATALTPLSRALKEELLARSTLREGDMN